MIAVTEQAASAIRRKTDTDAHPHAGLRIKSIGDGKFAVGIVPQPAGGDVVVHLDGANLYLEPSIAQALNRATLDADPTASGLKEFVLVNADLE